MEISQRDIYEARNRIQPFAQRTALISSDALEEGTGGRVFLKLENQQVTGSFKIRGAANKLLHLNKEVLERGVVCVSSGNHGRAVSYVARRLGVRSVVCATPHVPKNKQEAILRLGAEVDLRGANQDEAEAKALEYVDGHGMTFVHPFDDLDVITGQGTIGLEILEDLPDVDTVIVPLSGGGLISGISLALKTADPSIRILGVTMKRGPAMYLSLKEGEPVSVEEEETLADALMGGIGLNNRFTFRLCQQYLDDVHLVSEEEIARAMAFAFREHRVVVEGGGAVGLAAVLHHKVDLGSNTAIVVSGGNVDVETFADILRSSE